MIDEMHEGAAKHIFFFLTECASTVRLASIVDV